MARELLRRFRVSRSYKGAQNKDHNGEWRGESGVPRLEKEGKKTEICQESEGGNRGPLPAELREAGKIPSV